MSQVRYTIGTISSNWTQFNTAIIWLIRVQLSVILPRFELECKESWDVLQYEDIFHFGNFPVQYQLSNDFSFKQIQNLLTNTTKTSKLQKCIWKYHFIRTSKTLHIVQITFQRRCAALLTKRRKLLFNLREIVPMYLSSQDTSKLCTAEMMTVNQLLTSKLSNPCGAFWRMLSAHI